MKTIEKLRILIMDITPSPSSPSGKFRRASAEIND